MLRMPRVPSAVGEQTVRRARQGTPHRRRRVWQQRAAAGGTSATCLLPPRPAPKPARLSHAMVLLSWLLLPLRVAAVAASAWWQGAPAVPEGPIIARLWATQPGMHRMQPLKPHWTWRSVCPGIRYPCGVPPVRLLAAGAVLIPPHTHTLSCASNRSRTRWRTQQASRVTTPA